jgi:tRNA threonylcarbamoyladenosine biosynthesis protein TsaB
MFLGFKEIAENKYNILSDDLFCPALDARRMEIYYSVYDAGGKTVKGIRAEIIDRNSLNDLPVNARLFIFGDGAAKCRGVIERGKTVFDDTFRMSASFMREAAYKALDTKRFEDVAYFEPFYLKDFLATKPVKNILGK